MTWASSLAQVPSSRKPRPYRASRRHTSPCHQGAQTAESINSSYSSITFAISDPDGSISSKLMQGRTALFGKEVTVECWVDKPALVQCSCCHALGHTKASKVCPLSANSFKGFRCGGAHRSEELTRNALGKHAVAVICDCGQPQMLETAKVQTTTAGMLNAQHAASTRPNTAERTGKPGRR